MPRKNSGEVITLYAANADVSEGLEYHNSSKSLYTDSGRLMLNGKSYRGTLAVRIDPEKNQGREYIINADGMRGGWGVGGAAFQRRAIETLRNNVQLPQEAFGQAFKGVHGVHAVHQWQHPDFMEEFRQGNATITWYEDEKMHLTCKKCGAVVDETQENVETFVPCGHPRYVKEERTLSRWRRRNGEKGEKYTHTQSQMVWHHQATSVGVRWVDAQGEVRHYVSSWDENENRHYFLCEVPLETSGLANALFQLKPDAVSVAELEGRTVRRQGDIFAIKTDVAFNVRKERRESKGKGRDNQVFDTRHYVPYMMIQTHQARSVDAEVWGYGSMYHITRAGGRNWGREVVEGRHRRVNLDGNTWWRLVKNTAIQGWQVSGRVD